MKEKVKLMDPLGELEQPWEDDENDEGAAPPIDTTPQRNTTTSENNVTSLKENVKRVSSEEADGFICMADVTLQPISWLWPEMLAYGKISIFAGEPGMGKSQAAIAIAAILSRGCVWPDGALCSEKGNTLIVSAEDDRGDTVGPRLVAAGADMKRIFSYSDKYFNVTKPSTLLESEIKKNNIKLLIIDPISAYLGSKVDSNKNSDVRGALMPLKSMAQRLGIAVIFITHFNKSKEQGPLNRITGSGAFVALARAVFYFIKYHKDPRQRVFLNIKNNLGPLQPPIAYKIDRYMPRIEGIDEKYWLDPKIKTTRLIFSRDAIPESAEELMDGQLERTKKGSKTKDSLKAFLEDGPMLTEKAVKLVVASTGCSRVTVFRAAKDIGVYSTGGNKNKMWSLTPIC